MISSLCLNVSNGDLSSALRLERGKRNGSR